MTTKQGNRYKKYHAAAEKATRRLNAAHKFYNEVLEPLVDKGEGFNAEELARLISQFQKGHERITEFSYRDLEVSSNVAFGIARARMEHPFDDAETARKYLESRKRIHELIEGAKPNAVPETVK